MSPRGKVRASCCRTSAANCLATGGGIVKALPLLGPAPFFLLNSDTTWIDGVRPNLPRLAESFDDNAMDALLLLAPATATTGYGGAAIT